MRLGSLCTGYGGLDMAVEAHYGADLAWYSEIDKDCSQLLAHHWPTQPNLGDLTQIDWNRVDPVDIMCAGFPCQPFSHAGKREGENDDRAIFAYIADAVSVLRPGIVVLENVAGILTLGGPGVIGTLTGLGYDLRWGIVRASDAGAPHRRARWFCVARSADPSSERHGSRENGRGVGHLDRRDESQTRQRQRPRPEPVDRGSEAPTDTAGVGFGEGAGSGESKPTGQRRDGPGDSHRTAPTDPDSPGGEARVNAGHSRKRVRVEPVGHPTLTTDTAGAGFQGIRSERRLEEESGEPRRLSRFGPYEPAIERWERILGRPAPDPTDDRGLRPGFVEWMMGLPEGHVCGLGMSRTAELKALGNGVCPQQAALALTLLDE